jgi:hypothetical protein
MALLTVVRDVCAAVGVALPTTVFGSLQANRTMQEMVALGDEMAQRIAYDLRDWTVLRTTATYVGDGVTTSFALPVDFKRMLLTSNVWRSTSTQEPMMFVSDVDEWVRRRSFHESGAWGEWILMGGRLHIAPAMGVGVSARHSYLDKNCVTLASGGFGDRFTDDADSFRLDERLLKLGMIWQWMANKGSPYAEPMGTYSDAIANAMGHDQPAPIIIGRTLLPRGTRNASY